MQMNTQAVVVGSRVIDGEDRLLTLLSSDLGVIRAYAKGKQRMKGAAAAATELLCYSSFVLFYHKERYTVDHADSINQFFGLRGDIEKLSLATYFAELSSVIVPQSENAGAYLRLLLNTLHLLEHGERSRAFLKPLFELRALTLSGFMPDLVACGECACYESGEMYFSVAEGGLLCGECRERRAVSGALLELPRGVLAAMRHIIYSPIERLFQFELPPQALERLGEAAEKYLIYQTERNYATLDFYKSIITGVL